MRVRRVFDRAKPGCILDMHSSIPLFNEILILDSIYYSHSPVLTYMELLPFIDKTWYGEGYDYQGETPDYWL